ncbi:MAG TPA: cysteine desulfurase-like protein [Kineosporiaceae bacterium]|nr:cysteine desulfurase-like protein [Kineosporiaceae bacterium]
MTDYDVHAVRDCYPALADGWAYLDGAAGTQVPRAVIEAESAAYAAGMGNHGGYFAAARRSDALTAAARQAVADLVGAPSPDAVALGPSTTALTYRFAEGLAKTWREGDEIVLTRLDHDANVRPWVQAAARTGVRVHWADPVLPSLDLPVEAVTGQLSARTRLVAVTAASNVVGTRPDVRAIADAAHAVGALVYVDGVHATPHGPVDVVALGADLYATSAYKWSGPHLAAVVAAGPGTLGPIHPDKLDSATEAVPERFERGTSPFAQHAGIAAAVDHLAGLADLAVVDRAGSADLAGVPATRRERIIASMNAVQAYETALFRRLLDGLAGLDRVHRIGSPARQAPTVWFTVDGLHPDQVAEQCANARVNVWSGHNYAWELAGLLGIRGTGSAVRASVSCYTTVDEIDRLLGVLSALP